MTRRFAALLLALTLVGSSAVFLVGCSEGGGEVEDATTPAAEQTEVSESAESVAGDVGAAPGQVPPPFTLKDLDGGDVSLTDFEGKVVVLDLWATWCGPCRVEIPFLVSLYNDHRDEGLVVLGVGLDRGGAAVLAPFAEEYSVTYPVLVADRAVPAAYGVRSIPMTLVIGRDGRVAHRHVGFTPAIGEQMEREVVALLAVGAEGA